MNSQSSATQNATSVDIVHQAFTNLSAALGTIIESVKLIPRSKRDLEGDLSAIIAEFVETLQSIVPIVEGILSDLNTCK